jgi:small subunit ribosomal protein S7
MRRKKNFKRNIDPDSVHNSVAVSRFVNHLMLDGKKATAEKVVWDALEVLKKKSDSDKDAAQLLEDALNNVAPSVEIRPRRVGGATYQVPREVRPERKMALAMRWIIGAARSKSGKPMAERLAEEFLLASKNEGTAIKKKLDTHRMADANRAFAHFAW